MRKILFPAFYALSLIYGGIATAWRQLPTRPWRPGVPIISVGSIIAGGTGKTPLCILVARMLAGSGHKVCVISRGYMRKSRRSPLVVSDGRQILAGVGEAGDEPYLLAGRLRGVQVIVDANRARAVAAALSGERPDVFVLDDGFQTRSVVKDLELVCLDAQSVLERQFFLPLGRLRESRGSIKPGHVIVLKLEQDERKPDASSLGPLAAWPVFVARRQAPVLIDSEGGRVEAGANAERCLILSGIARPEGFEESCVRAGLEAAASLRVDDHHWYSEKDATEILGLMERHACRKLVTTEKDFHRLPDALRARALVLIDSLAVEEPERFSELLEKHAGRR